MVISSSNKTDIAAIKRALAILFQPGDVSELRAFNKKGFALPGYYDNFTKLAEDAARLSNREDIVSVYVLPNVIKKALLARAANHLYPEGPGEKKTTTDADVLKRRWFIIDIDADCDGVKGISSTDEEHQATIDTAHDIMKFLFSIGFPKDSMILASSGNGAHILVRIEEMLNTEANTELIKTCLMVLSTKFKGIDLTVYNPSRVFKLTGTVCRKGDVIEGRPHRASEFLEVPENIVIAPITAMTALKELMPKNETPAPKPVYQRKGNNTPFVLETWIYNHNDRVKVKSKEPYKGGTRYILEECPFDSNHNGTSAAIIQLANGAINYTCLHNGCVNNDWHKLREMCDPEYATNKQRYEGRGYTRPEPGTARSEYHHLTDIGNAERLMDRYGDIIRYDYDRKMWLIWNGKYWVWDDGSAIMKLAQVVARGIYSEITPEDDEETAKAKAKWAAASESNPRLQAMIAQAQPMARITLDELDANPWLLNCANGTINLKTGWLQPHKPNDYITRMITTNYNPDATSGEWVKFLKRTFGDKKELISFCKRALGYSITGVQIEQAIFFCNGIGWNGKSTLLGACRLILGEYAAEVDPSAFMVDKNRGTGPNEAIASLYKVNFVTSTEIEDGQKLATSLLKRMSGGEALRCERKFEHGFNFKPQHKLWLCGNHEPEVTDTTNSIWNRLKKIPFSNVITTAERIKGYDVILARDHGEAILAFLVQGCLEWQKDGLGESDDVKEATQTYRDNQDLLHDFLAECCSIETGETVTISDLYKAYLVWSEANGDRHFLGKLKFNSKISEKGFVKAAGGHNKTVWHGLKLLDESVKSVKSVNENPVSLPYEGNDEKLPQNMASNLTQQPTLRLNTPTRVKSLDENCPVCGGLNFACWPDGSTGYYCVDCYPNFSDEPNF